MAADGGAPDRGAPERGAPERIFIVGGMGSGKTTLADEIGGLTGLPVTHLDDVAREGGGGLGPERPLAEREEMVAATLRSERWIAEGVHLGWTQPLLDAADLIVWLDNIGSAGATGRLVRRFVTQALAEARNRRGREKFLRLRDYGRRMRELAVALPEARHYYRGSRDNGGGTAPVSRAQIESALAGHAPRVVRCRTTADVRAFVSSIGAGSPG